REARAHLEPGIGSHQRVVDRIEHAEWRDLRRSGRGIEPTRRDRDVPRHGETPGWRRSAGAGEVGAERKEGGERQPERGAGQTGDGAAHVLLPGAILCGPEIFFDRCASTAARAQGSSSARLQVDVTPTPRVTEGWITECRRVLLTPSRVIRILNRENYQNTVEQLI